MHFISTPIDYLKLNENAIVYIDGLKLTKERKRYSAKTITDTDYADDISFLANAPVQAKTLLHSQERFTAGISFHVNAHKTEYMSFN